jgi:prepilin peptidase CpaA
VSRFALDHNFPVQIISDLWPPSIELVRFGDIDPRMTEWDDWQIILELDRRGGFDGLAGSVKGCLLGFGVMLMLHIFGALGAGDVKLFAAIGSIIGVKLVLPTLVVVSLVGGVLAIYTMLRANLVRTTMLRVLQIFVGLLPGWQMPRFSVPADKRHTIPYGVAITVGSLISLAIFRA